MGTFIRPKISKMFLPDRLSTICPRYKVNGITWLYEQYFLAGWVEVRNVVVFLWDVLSCLNYNVKFQEFFHKPVFDFRKYNGQDLMNSCQFDHVCFQ